MTADANGDGDSAAETGTKTGAEPDEGGDRVRREKSYRGISRRLAVHYLENLGGEAEGEDRVVGDGWTASLSAEKVGVGPTMDLTEVTVVFEGAEAALNPLIERFSRKAMRAGG